MANNEKNNWDQANRQGENIDSGRNNSNREFHHEDDRVQNRNAEGNERPSQEFSEDENGDVTRNDLSESDDSYGHGKEYYSRNYVPGGRSVRDDIPSNDSGA